MRIAEMFLDGFGIFHGVSLRDLSPGITVFEGQNEAGKTTLMAFVRAVLFGFEGRKSGNNRYEPAHGGRHGGALIVMTEDGKRFRVERNDTGTRGQVKVTNVSPFQQTVHESKETKDEELLLQLMYGTSKFLYQNVFAFGISELERLDTLQADEVSSHIYTVGMGTGLTPLTTVLNALEQEQGQLFKPGGKKPVINQLVQRLDETHGIIRELQMLPDDYYALRERLVVLDREIVQYQKQLEEAKREANWVESLVKARPDWEQLQVVQQELKDLPTVESFPAGGIERFEQLSRAQASVEVRLDETKRAIAKAEERREELRLDSSILAHQADIETLEELRGRSNGLVQTLLDLRSRAAFRRKVLDEILTRLGPTWNDERLDRFEATIPIRERIRGLRDELDSRRQEVLEAVRSQKEVDKTRIEKESALERLQEKLERLSLFQPTDRPSLEEREQALRRWFQFQHRLELTQQHHQDVQGQSAALDEQILTHKKEIVIIESQKGLPAWVLIVLGMVFAIPAAFSGVQQDFFSAIIFATAGILAVGLLAWWRHDLQSQRKTRLHKLRTHYKMLMTRLEDLQSEQRQMNQEEQRLEKEMNTLSQHTLGAELSGPDSAETAFRTLEAERRLTERQEDLNLRIQAEEEALVKVLEKSEVAGKIRKKAEQSREKAQQAWATFLTAMGLPDELTPDGALEVLSGAERAQVQLGEWRDVTQELQRLEVQAEETTTKINLVLQECGWSLINLADAPASLTALKKALDESLSARSELDRLNQVIKEKLSELETGKAEKARSVEQLNALLKAGGAHDPETFRRRAILHARQVELQGQQRQLEVALRIHVGSPERYQEMEGILSLRNRAELEQELEDINREGQQRLGEILTKHLQEKGRVEQQIQNLEQNERLSVTLLERQSLLAQLDQQAQRWATKAICQYLLEKARQIYEKERQPAVLREASKFFNIMTNGRYTRVMVPLGEMRLEVETSNGKAQTTDRLSRGTAEQLYLAMRLAFVREYAKHAGPLPLVVDDIFVNFDPNRAKAAIKVFWEISDTHQILVFTCHPHVSKWFQETLDGVSVRSIPKCA